MNYGRRKTFRCPVQIDRCHALLRIRRKDVAVRLEDESSGGFSISCTGNVPVKDGQALQLLTDYGWCKVKVVHRQREDDRTRIGLQRMEDDPPIARRKKIVPWWTKTAKKRNRTKWLAWVGFVLAIVAALGISIMQLQLERPTWWTSLFGTVAEAEPPIEPQQVEQWQKQLVARVGRISELVTKPGYNLNEQQRTELKRILTSTSAELEALYLEQRANSPGEWWKKSSAEIDRAQELASALLTDAQRQQWKHSTRGK